MLSITFLDEAKQVLANCSWDWSCSEFQLRTDYSKRILELVRVYNYVKDLISRPKRATDNGITYDFVQDDNKCTCVCDDGNIKPPQPPKQHWHVLFMIDSSACIEPFLRLEYRNILY